MSGPELEERRPPLSLSKRILFAIAILLLVLVSWFAIEIVADLLLPSRNPYHDSDHMATYLKEGRLTFFLHDFYWELMPNARSVTNEGVSYVMNSLGFNCADFSPLPRAGVTRIVALGDSSVFGFRVPAETSFPSQLEARLEEQMPERTFEVVNAGVPGYTTTQGLILLRTRLLALRPKLLILSFGWNDEKAIERALTGLHNLVHGYYSLYRIVRFGHEHTRFVRGLVRGVSELELLLAYPDPPDRAGQVRSAEKLQKRLGCYRKNLEQMVDLCRHRGIEAVFCPISVPPLFEEEMRTLAEEKRIPFVETEALLVAAKEGLEAPAPGKESAVAILRNELSFSEIRTSKDLFVDGCHPTPRGYRVVVDAALPVVQRLLAPGEN